MPSKKLSVRQVTPDLLGEVIEHLAPRSRAELQAIAEDLGGVVSFELLYKLKINRYTYAIGWERVRQVHQWLLDHPLEEET